MKHSGREAPVAGRVSRRLTWRARGRGAACVLGLLLAAGPAAAQNDRLEVHYIDVGQGDATLVRCPNGAGHMVIDGGELSFRYPNSAEQFQAYITRELPNPPRRIDIVVASHPHSDHIGSLEWLFQTYTVGTYVDNGQRVESPTWVRLDKLVRKRVQLGQLEYVNGKKTEFTEVDFCPEVTVEVIAPWAITSLSDTNDRSVFVRLTYRQTAFLFVGDAHVAAEDVLLGLPDAQRAKLAADVLKVGHHGSRTSSGATFVGAVSPRVAVISSGSRGVGTNAGHKHPRWQTVQTLLNHFKQLDMVDHQHGPSGRIWVFDTDWSQRQRRRGLCVTAKDGAVVVRSDGVGIDVAVEACRPQ